MEAIEDCISNMELIFSVARDEDLQKEFTREKIEEALKQIRPLKSPGSDGFGTQFY